MEGITGGTLIAILSTAQALIELHNAADPRAQGKSDTLILFAHDSLAATFQPRYDAAIAHQVASGLDELGKPIPLEGPFEFAHGRNKGRRDGWRSRLLREHAFGVDMRESRSGASPESGLNHVACVCTLQAKRILVLGHHLRDAGEKASPHGYEVRAYMLRVKIHARAPAALNTKPSYDTPVNQIGDSGSQGDTRRALPEQRV